MNLKNLMPPLVCGFGAAVVVTIPGMQTLGCCLLAPFAGGFSVFLHNKLNNVPPPISGKTGSLMGLSTGLFIAFFAVLLETILTLIFKSNAFVEALPELQSLMKDFINDEAVEGVFGIYKRMAEDIRNYGFSAAYTFSILFSYTIIYSIFGLIGGLLGMIYVNKRA